MKYEKMLQQHYITLVSYQHFKNKKKIKPQRLT